MPAIRYYYHCLFLVADHLPSTKCVDVRTSEGGYVRLPWLGMICEHAMGFISGVSRVKIKAHEITDGDGVIKAQWKRLAPGQHVLGWRCELRSGNMGVYGVVDDDGWPIIVGAHGRVGKPHLKMLIGNSGV